MMDDGQGQNETAELVRATRVGDKTAFDRLVQLHQRQAMGLALGILANVDDAAEAVQEAFVKGYLQLGGLNQPERFRFWMLKIVANEAISRRRAARRQATMIRRFMADRVEKRAPEPEERGHAQDLQATMERAMRQLTASEARAIALLGLDDLPQSEVGRIMGCSPGAVRWHVHRARKKLRVLLKEFLE
jgi:RNA polymerase sigma-70 factor (ECF subfamily)